MKTWGREVEDDNKSSSDGASLALLSFIPLALTIFVIFLFLFSISWCNFSTISNVLNINRASDYDDIAMEDGR